MLTKIYPQSVNTQYPCFLLIQLRTKIEDKFADLHQMLDVRRQKLLDKLTDLEEIHKKYVEHTEYYLYVKHLAAINNLQLTFANIQQTCTDAMISDTQQSPLFHTKLERSVIYTNSLQKG